MFLSNVNNNKARQQQSDPTVTVCMSVELRNAYIELILYNVIHTLVKSVVCYISRVLLCACVYVRIGGSLYTQTHTYTCATLTRYWCDSATSSD